MRGGISVRRGFGWVGVAVALGLATLTSACTTAPPPPVESSSTTAATSSSSSPTTSSSATSSGSATTASGIPEAARANTADGAVAFTQYYFREVNRSYNTMT